ncbi:MAG: HAMP domain-containing sensor histidine kinase [bacterium]|nr:HAMP domain-containing histidine kinase [bacterium]MBU1917912.1 HAMP domain-containing histidine kinase [bacterium]
MTDNKTSPKESLIETATFVSRINHDVKNPLAIISQVTAQLDEEMHGPLNENQKKLLALSTKNITRIREILDDASLLCKLEANVLKYDSGTICLNDQIQDIISLLKAHKKHPAVVINTALPKENLYTAFDKELLTNVFLKLLTYALSWTEKGSVLITAIKKDAKIAIEITNTGYELSEKDIETAFEKFKMFRCRPRCEQKPTGLGFFIAKHIIEMFGGTLSLENQPEKGSVICMSFKSNKTLA